ncbi:uncharacterized protein LOC131438775 [Malaya genurostris]|uniref:uncharacterized protein LOC131438775 n=1 Tax=Malaya genurostris TaxID=325434 RepID=UPI0026F38D2C|nr:uncharacterized protein LOC131438775 [Malaya genurostris]
MLEPVEKMCTLDETSTALPVSNRGQKRNKEKTTLAGIALRFIGHTNGKASCCIDAGSDCQYAQEKIDIQNFIRHFRTRHFEFAKTNGLIRDQEVSMKKQRVIAKRMVAIDKQLLMDSLLKMITFHNLPLRCFQWDGFKQIIDPLASAVGVTINTGNMIAFLKEISQRIRAQISSEMQNRLLSLKIDSASRQNRHIVGVNAQYAINDVIVIRTLDMIEVQERQTARFLKTKILEIIQNFGVGIDQIFSITCDNGANMLATVRHLKEEVELMTACSNDDYDTEEEDKKLHNFTSALSNELQENLNLVRCAVHTLQLAILDVVDKSNSSVKAVTEIAKKNRHMKYKPNFFLSNATYPPIWGQTRWGGIYRMMLSFLQQESFFKQLAQQFPELELDDSWDFIKNYEQAFKPLYSCTVNMQAEHVSLPDFYLHWLMAIMEVSKLNNPFSTPLTEALTNRLKNLCHSRVFKMALYLDPRLNYMGSNLFKAEEKEQIQSYVIETYNKIRSYKKSTPLTALEISASTKKDDFDSFITAMFGECATSSGTTERTQFLQQLKALDVEPRQHHAFNVWKHWMDRHLTHPELSAVASVVLATPSNQVSVERSFSALPLIMTDRRSGISEENLRNILLVKLNRSLFDTIMSPQ